MANSSQTRRSNRPQNGYMLLVCTLAVTVLSVASLAIIRSSQQRVRLAEAQRFSTRGQTAADGLYQRALATLRSDPNANETIQDPGNGISGARATLERLSNNATRIEVFLYPNSTIPVISTVIDPGAITEDKGKDKDKDKGKDNDKGKDDDKDKGKGKDDDDDDKGKDKDGDDDDKGKGKDDDDKGKSNGKGKGKNSDDDDKGKSNGKGKGKNSDDDD